jgi:hypothetical protein
LFIVNPSSGFSKILFRTAALDNPDDLVGDLREFLGGHAQLFDVAA